MFFWTGNQWRFQDGWRGVRCSVFEPECRRYNAVTACCSYAQRPMSRESLQCSCAYRIICRGSVGHMSSGWSVVPRIASRRCCAARHPVASVLESDVRRHSVQIGSIHRESKKLRRRDFVINLSNSDRFSKFFHQESAIKRLLKIPLYVKRVDMLPCDTAMSKFSVFCALR